MVSRTTLLVPGLAFALASSLLLPRAARADIVEPPDPAGCSDKAKGDACKDHGQDGLCQPDKCSKLDYSQGTPPSTVEYDCLKCMVGAAPATPTPAVPAKPVTPATPATPAPSPKAGGCAIAAGDGGLTAALMVLLATGLRRRRSIGPR